MRAINPLPSPPFSTLPFRLLPKLFNFRPRSFSSVWLLPDASHKHIKQRPASVDALISSQAFGCQFQPQRSRLLIDREPKRIFNTSKVPARHLFPLTGTSWRSENTLTATLENTKEMHLWKRLSILPPKQECWLIFSVTHFLFCVSHERLWFKKSYI